MPRPKGGNKSYYIGVNTPKKKKGKKKKK